MWSPLFEKIVDSSLWREEDFVVKIFITLLAKKDSGHIVSATAFMIGEWAKKDEATTIKALKILSSPDTKRIEKQPFDGRRIEKVEDGWLILNGQFYEDQMRKINRRSYQASKQAEYRSKKKGVSQAYMAREARSVKAYEEGDLDQADNIAAEDLPQVHPP